jgi:hypothetical protein
MTAPGYDHTASFQEAFGVYDAAWFLKKAERELGRYHAATDREGRVDALLNFSSSIIALEDWDLLGKEENEADWRGHLRSDSSPHAFIVLIALVAKHRRLGDRRFSELRFEKGGLRIWTDSATPDQALREIERLIPSARVVSVQTEVDDDTIVGYTVTVDFEGFAHGGDLMPLEKVMREALTFWNGRLEPIAGQ